MVKDEEDFYPEADLPKANIVRRGKASLDSYYRHAWDTDTSEDECQELITLDAVPLNAFRPDPDTAPASGTRRRRAEAPRSEVPPGKAPPTEADRKSTRLNSSHSGESRMPSSA